MLIHLSQCEPPYTSWGCFLAENPVVTKFTLETDGVYGPYLKCNLQPRDIHAPSRSPLGPAYYLNLSPADTVLLALQAILACTPNP